MKFLKQYSYAIVLGSGASYLHGKADLYVFAFIVAVVVLVNRKSA